jgi:hypothetical protein
MALWSEEVTTHCLTERPSGAPNGNEAVKQVTYGINKRIGEDLMQS